MRLGMQVFSLLFWTSEGGFVGGGGGWGWGGGRVGGGEGVVRFVVGGCCGCGCSCGCGGRARVGGREVEMERRVMGRNR